jgi:hypothetical protein
MIDYGKIAAEEKAKQDALAVAVAEKQKLATASEVFFSNLETALGNEIGKANPELEKHGVLTGHKVGGIAMAPKRFESQIRMTYGRTAICEVNYESSNSTIQVEMTGEPDPDGPAKTHTIAFRVSHSETGSVAQKIESDGEVLGKFGAEEIAEVVIEGMIRGYFE